MSWIRLAQDYLMPMASSRLPIVIVRGEGVWVEDEGGRKYLDFVGGWAVNSLGHCHPVLVDRITKQAKELIHTSNQFYTIPQIKLAELLIKNSHFSKVFFTNSGAEAIETAIKLARKYGKIYRDGAYEIITAYNSFHGRTLGALAATGQRRYQEPFTPLPEGFVHVPFNDIEAIKKATSKKTVAVMLEPVQGEGGVNIPREGYLEGVEEWCKERGLLFILDEVQVGIGRLGELFAFQRWGLKPDIITLAKGLGGGVPIGAVLAKERASTFSPGDHASTFGGNPLACSAAYAVISFILEKDILAHVREVGTYFLEQLKKLSMLYPFISEARGMGLLLALEFKADIAEAVQLGCLRHGLLVNKLKPNTLRFMPPLIITKNEIDKGLEILENVLREIRSGLGFQQ